MAIRGSAFPLYETVQYQLTWAEGDNQEEEIDADGHEGFREIGVYLWAA